MKLTIAIIAMLITAPVSAAPNCASVAQAYSILMQKFGESRRMRALSNRGHIIEMWANDETSTWTVLIVKPDGTACIVDEGEAFDLSDSPAEGEPL